MLNLVFLDIFYSGFCIWLSVMRSILLYFSFEDLVYLKPNLAFVYTTPIPKY